MTLLAGGVGGARMARALRTVIDPGNLTVVVNVGDDTERYGVYVSADPDTVLYTLADVQGPYGWGRRDDTTVVMDHLGKLGVDTTFRLGDADLALCLARTSMMADGVPLSSITSRLSAAVGVSDTKIIPATDDRLATYVQIVGGEWLEFQEYFVDRHHADPVAAIAYHGAATAVPAPGVIDAITGADVLLIAPSNPPLSIWPILAIDAIQDAVEHHPCRGAVSPLFGGTPLKGPADRVMAGLGLSRGTRGILEAYRGTIDHLFVDINDSDDVHLSDEFDVSIHPVNTHMETADNGQELAARILEEMRP